MMEKSSEVVLSEDEKAQILGKKKMTKQSSEGDARVPDRFQGWYEHEELKEIANGND